MVFYIKIKIMFLFYQKQKNRSSDRIIFSIITRRIYSQNFPLLTSTRCTFLFINIKNHFISHQQQTNIIQYNLILFSTTQMRLDATYLHFMSREELRILAAIEMGMRNHQYVPIDLITKIGNLRGGETFKTVRKLLKNKFIVHIGNKCDGYKLTYLGYDYLALQTLIKRGVVKDVIGKIGVGKQSDIYKCITPDGEFVVLKLTRLGRNSFKTIKKNREYIQHRTNYNWLYLSRLSSIRQFLFMQMLYENKFPTPVPIDTNRHAIVMSLIDGDTLCHIQRIQSQEEIKTVFQQSLEMLVKFAKNGLIHGDYNEFNLMLNDDCTKLTVIDFPQCISSNHPNAKEYFDRDAENIYIYFDRMAKKSFNEKWQQQPGDMQKGKFQLNVEDYPMPKLQDVVVEKRLDHQIKEKGHISLKEYSELDNYRSEEERMRAEFEKLKIKEQSQDQEKEQEEDEEEEEEFDQEFYEDGCTEEKIQDITLENKQKYDVELESLINELGGNEKEQKKEQQQEDESSEEEERFRGLTPYQIRIKIKQEKRVERQKKKQALHTEDFIKKALKKKNHSKPINRGNHGNKKKVKEEKMEIKVGHY